MKMVFVNIVHGDIVDSTTAKIVALNFYLNRINSGSQIKSSKVYNLQLVHQEFENTDGKFKGLNIVPLYYVFNVQDKGGFVIVSAEDKTKPILGYSF